VGGLVIKRAAQAAYVKINLYADSVIVYFLLPSIKDYTRTWPAQRGKIMNKKPWMPDHPCSSTGYLWPAPIPSYQQKNKSAWDRQHLSEAHAIVTGQARGRQGGERLENIF